MNRTDTIDIEILDDGRIKTTTPGSVSAANHSNAEAFFRYIATMTDGDVSRSKLKHDHQQHQHRTHATEGAK